MLGRGMKWGRSWLSRGSLLGGCLEEGPLVQSAKLEGELKLSSGKAEVVLSGTVGAVS